MKFLHLRHLLDEIKFDQTLKCIINVTINSFDAGFDEISDFPIYFDNIREYIIDCSLSLSHAKMYLISNESAFIYDVVNLKKYAFTI